MDYEKKYKEAFDAAEKIYNNMKEGGNFGGMEDLEVIFSELAESEDEKFLNYLINCCKGTIESNDKGLELSMDTTKRLLAWLEKQGEHYNFRQKIQVGDQVTRNEDGMLVNLSQLERVAKPAKKQGEQKSAERNILSARKGDMLSDGTIVLIVDSIEEFEGRPIINSWYFADSEKFYGKGTNECDRWEVDGFRTATEAECNYLLKMMVNVGYEWDADKLELRKIEQKPAWSEEDEQIYEGLMYDLDKLKPSFYFPISENAYDWLKAKFKSFRPQKQWKPSDEQMEVLVWCKPLFVDPKSKAVLESLINDLKKLKEE